MPPDPPRGLGLRPRVTASRSLYQKLTNRKPLKSPPQIRPCGTVLLNDLEEFGRFEADEKSISRQIPRSQMSWKTLESPGSNQRHLADRKIALYNYQLSQIFNYKTDGSFVNFRRMTFQSTQKTTEDVVNGHSKECRSFDVDLHCYTFKIRFRAVYTQAPTAGHARSHPEHAAAKRGHHRLFFLSEKKGGSSAPSEPPLATCLSFHGVYIGKS